MIIVTGGAGFIGSAIVWKLNEMGIDNILIVDHLGSSEKWKNLRALRFADYLEKDEFLDRIQWDEEWPEIDCVFHMGACSSTTEKNASYLIENNFEFTRILSSFCAERNIRFIYASSAATYGLGESGYADIESEIHTLRPLNMYGYSKQMFDLWARRQGLLSQQVGLKFFNVYGPNEAHKDDMRSVVHKAFEQIRDTGHVELFRSYRSDFKDGEQKRDFIYIKDAVAMAIHFFQHREIGGLFNIGTGKARSWNDLVRAVFTAMDKPEKIQYVEMPGYLQPKYQYFTESDSRKIVAAGYSQELYSLEQGIMDYVRGYLLSDKFLGD